MKINRRSASAGWAADWAGGWTYGWGTTLTTILPIGFAVVSGGDDPGDRKPRKSVVGLALAAGLAVGLPVGFASVGFAFSTMLLRMRVA